MKKILLLILIINNVVVAQTAINWSMPMDVAPSSEGNLHPRIVTDGNGDPMIIWGKLSSNECKFSKWNGTAFTTPVVLNPSTIPIFTQQWAGPDIAAKGDTVYVVFKHTPEDVNHIYVTTSFDGGANFMSPVRVDYISAFNSRFPTVTVDDNGNPIVAYMKFDPGFSNARWVVSRSGDYGNTFSAGVLASGWSGGAVCDCCPGSVVSSGNTVAMLYRDNLNNMRDSWCGISNDSGSTFSGGLNVDQNNWMLMACPSTGPDGVKIGDSLYSVFMNGAAFNNGRVYISSTSIAGMQAQPSQLLSNAVANYPRIANSEKAVAVVYKQTSMGSGELILQFTNDIDSGVNMQSDTLASGGVVNGDVAVYDGKVYVVWEDDNSGTIKYQKGTYTPLINSIKPNDVNSKSDLILYPNPSNNFIYLRSSYENISEYTISNIEGQVISSRLVSDKLVRVDISNLSAGIYFVKIVASDKTSVLKFTR